MHITQGHRDRPRSRRSIAASLSTAILLSVILVLLVLPTHAQAGETEVFNIGNLVTVGGDDDSHRYQIYTSTTDTTPSVLTWAGFVGFVSEAAIVIKAEAEEGERETLGVPNPVWQRLAAAAVAGALTVTQIIQGSGKSDVQARLIIYDRKPGAELHTTPPCYRPRIPESEDEYPNMAKCPLFQGMGLSVLTGKGIDTVDLTGINCRLSCFNPYTQPIEVNTADGGDTIYGSDYGELLQGGLGHDTIKGGNGPDKIYGFWRESPFHNLMFRNTPVASDVEFGTAGLGEDTDDDRLFGEGGIDIMSGGPGNDLVDGGPNDDKSSALVFNLPSIFPDLPQETYYELQGGAGEDVIIGGAGRDGMQGGPGRDTMLSRESDYGDRNAPDDVDCAKPQVGPPLDGPEYYRSSTGDNVVNCTQKLSKAPDKPILDQWPSLRWWWYQ